MTQIEPAVSLDQAKAVVATKTAPRVTEDSIKAKIGDVTYWHMDQLTVCVITMRNGFHVVGHSAPASPANYDEQIGERFAYENAFRQLWAFEGYALRVRLDAEERAKIEAEVAAKGNPDVAPTAAV